MDGIASSWNFCGEAILQRSIKTSVRCSLFWLIIGSIVISPIVLIIKGLIRFGNIKIGYMLNKDTAITIGKSVFWIMRFVFSLATAFIISLVLYLVVVVVSDAIAQGEIYMILAVIGIFVIVGAIIGGFLYYLIHYDEKMEKVGYHYKDLDNTKDKYHLCFCELFL